MDSKKQVEWSFEWSRSALNMSNAATEAYCKAKGKQKAVKKDLMEYRDERCTAAIDHECRLRDIRRELLTLKLRSSGKLRSVH